MKTKTPTFSHDTDPYGALTFAIGSDDDFHCFDYAVSDCGQFIKLHGTINSETGSFIQDLCEPDVIPLDEAPELALGYTDQAIDWLGDNDLVHDEEGWNQDCYYFYRCVLAASKGLYDAGARIKTDNLCNLE